MSEPFISMTANEADIFMKGNTHPIRERVAHLVGKRKVIDLGCGRGIKIRKLYNPGSYLGIDCSKALIKVAQRDNPNHVFIVKDILEVLKNFKTKSIQISIMVSVLEHVPSLEIAQEIYKEAKRVSKELIIGWHHPPYYKETEIIKVKAELQNLMWQNHYKKGSFNGFIKVEKIELAEIWRVCD